MFAAALTSSQRPIRVVCVITCLLMLGRVLASRPAVPIRGLFWAAGFSFSLARLYEEVPIDASLRHLFFGKIRVLIGYAY